MNFLQKQAIEDAVHLLKEVAAGRYPRQGSKKREQGLCYLILKPMYIELEKHSNKGSMFTHILEEGLDTHIEKNWKHFSGNITYPVPHPDRTNDVLAARAKFIDMVSGKADIYTRKYGELRKDLARFIAAYLEDKYICN